eukprot:Tbor_TRINITY_DN2687_c0_g1::TRINITY_DN2687_c0_g1_i1::g.17892::m.17892/K16457/CEP76; centrosomal protein CEP76
MTDKTISDDRLKEMRKAINNHLQASNMYGEIRDIIDTYAADHIEFNPNDAGDVMRVLQERGIVQQVLNRMGGVERQCAAFGTGGTVPQPMRDRSILKGIKPNEKYLHIRLTGGRAFIDNLDLDRKEQKSTQMVMCAHYDRQRFRSTPQESLVDPMFDDDFLVHLDKGHGDIVDLATPLHISVIKEECSLGRCHLVGENTIEWRKVLRTGYMSLTVELCGSNPSIPSGIIEMEIELIPGGPKYPEEEILDRIQLQRTAVIAADREFLIYARRWWSEYHSIRASHKGRHVKLFAATSSGRMVPVTHYVSVIGPDRSLDSPFAAARFVSLFTLTNEHDTTTDVLLGHNSSKSSSQIWPSQFTFLSQKHGEIANHATLLCSLLLGFALDAYCVIGAAGGKLHMWVVTRTRVSSGEYDVTFWEPSSGLRYEPNGAHKYTAVGCAFNHLNFYANSQENDSAVTTKWNFDNEIEWCSLNILKLKFVPKFPNPPILYISLNARLIETDLESTLREFVGNHRDTLGLQTYWDDSLSAVLSYGLVQYERQRVEGNGKQDISEINMFHRCVKGAIGDGRTFKGFPLNVSHINENRISSNLLASIPGKEILDLVGDDLKHGLRVKCFVFPEGLVSVWVMIAARYRPLT